MENEFAWEVEGEKTWSSSIEAGLLLGKKKKKRSSRPQVTVKTSVRVSVYMVEEKGIKIENKNTKKISDWDDYDCNRDKQRKVRSVLSSRCVVGCRRGEPRDETGGCLRRTISPVCGGPWRGRGTLMGAGCCCLLRSNSSYTLDMCHAVWPQNRI